MESGAVTPLDPTKAVFWFGCGGGGNLSKVNSDNFQLSYLASYQISFEIESFIFSKPNNAKSALLFGYSFESKNYNILNSSNQTIQLESEYITIPIKFQYTITEVERIPLNILLGGFFSFLNDEESLDKDIKYLSDVNYGLIFGFNVKYFLESGWYVFIEYNIQYGVASLKNTISTNNSVSHLINIGCKFASSL